VDIDAQTLNYDLGRLADAVTNQTRMIVVVNLLGNPNDFSAIRQIVGHRDVVILEDNCESLGAVYDAKHTGTFGIMGTFSFFFSHHISTMEGGMVATDDEELYHILLSLRAHGWTRNLPRHNRVCADRTDDPFSELFRFVLPGFNVRPLELSGAVGVEQLKKLPEFIRVRRENAQIFQKLMKNYPYFDIQKELGQSNWFGFSLVIKKEAPFSRNQVLQKLDEKRIEYRPIVAGNFAQTEVMKWLDYTIHGELDNANHITQNGFFVGNHHYPLQQQLALLAEAIGDFRS
jgi:CDP-6-deoxy-D-xylo-4-hexulose-3-dehydrase